MVNQLVRINTNVATNCDDPAHSDDATRVQSVPGSKRECVQLLFSLRNDFSQQIELPIVVGNRGPTRATRFFGSREFGMAENS